MSFAHGSNDGQKGMGLIMLILIGAAADRLCAEPRGAGQPHAGVPGVASQEIAAVLYQHRAKASARCPARIPRAPTLETALKSGQLNYAAGRHGDLERWPATSPSQVKEYGTLNKVPAAAVKNIRNDMFLVAEAIRLMQKKA